MVQYVIFQPMFATLKRRCMKKLFGLCTFMFIGVAVCSPQDVTRGNWLLTSCQFSVKSIDDPHSPEDQFEGFRDGYCRGLVQGIATASPKVCQGENVTVGQEVRVVFKYLQDHPEELDKRNTTLVEKALVKAFPCQQ
jgi:hypothetical protein